MKPHNRPETPTQGDGVGLPYHQEAELEPLDVALGPLDFTLGPLDLGLEPLLSLDTESLALDWGRISRL
jgi:hypothetical protein